MNNKDYLLEEAYDPQSRYKDLSRFEPEFWKKKKLSEMSKEEWELLCDGCGKCCLNKLEIKGKIKFTNTRCRFLDCQSCLCQIYYHRFEKVLTSLPFEKNPAGCPKPALTGCWTTVLICRTGIR